MVPSAADDVRAVFNTADYKASAARTVMPGERDAAEAPGATPSA
jgi:hypothetical protein